LPVPYFYPKHRDSYWAILEKAYADARAEAAAVAAAKKIEMKIEFLKPVHLNLTEYQIPGSADKEYTLKSNVGIFPFGIMNNDPTFDYMKWWKGAKTQYIGDWFTRPIYFFEEREGAYAGKLDAYYFRGDQTFTFNAHSTTGSTKLDAWILAFAVMPVTLEETKIIV
jgi:hypothetical protein